MIRATVLFASLCLLGACATPSGYKPLPPVDHPAPKAPDPRICAPVEDSPAVPDDASLVAPVTDAERRGLKSFLSFNAALVDHDKRMTDRARLTAGSPPCNGR